jgi:hypothetical protein
VSLFLITPAPRPSRSHMCQSVSQFVPHVVVAVFSPFSLIRKHQSSSCHNGKLDGKESWGFNFDEWSSQAKRLSLSLSLSPCVYTPRASLLVFREPDAAADAKNLRREPRCVTASSSEYSSIRQSAQTVICFQLAGDAIKTTSVSQSVNQLQQQKLCYVSARDARKARQHFHL